MKEPNWKSSDEVDAFLDHAAEVSMKETSEKVGFPLEKYPCQAGLFRCLLTQLLTGKNTVEESRKFLVKYYSKPEVPRDTSVPQ